MVMQVKSIRHMPMRVLQRWMAMAMAVFADRHRLVDMLVVAVVMPMGVLVLQRFVGMFVAVGLGQMQHHTGQHQPTAQCHDAAD